MSCGTEGPNGFLWETSVVVPDSYECDYGYIVFNEHSNLVIKRESCAHHLKVPQVMAGSGGCMLITDHFQSANTVATIYKSAAFKDVIFKGYFDDGKPLAEPTLGAAGLVSVRFTVLDYTLLPGKAVYVTGGIPELGEWTEQSGLPLQYVGDATWATDLTVPSTRFPFSYRYFITDEQLELVPNCLVQTEGGPERSAVLGALRPPDSNGVADAGAPPLLMTLNDGHFQHSKPWRGSGLAIPVFSLRTKDSVGCGEFLDIKKMVTFVAACGMHVLQVLPVNDTQVYKMWWDSYPYSATSVFALHPIYMSLPALVSGRAPPRFLEQVAAARKKHTGIDMDYEVTLADKLRLARLVFDGSQGNQDLQSADYKRWVEDNQVWLKPYAAFCFLRDLFGSADHRQWGIMHDNAPQHVERLTSPEQPFHRDLLFIYWLQWHLHKQLLEAADFARAQRVVLKGDLPIGVAKSSADTWHSPHLFRMDVSVGSPPDAFDSKGQNWGFPGYNWEEMSKDGYLWWRRRLGNMAQYFTAYRVDHILGFFRIYEVPERHVSGALGHFRPSRPLFRKGLENVGLWDVERLSEPFIPEWKLREELQDDADEVIGRYLEAAGTGMLQFKAAFRSERSIEGISIPPESPQWLVQKVERIRSVLMKLLAEVILVRDEADPNKFFPRFDLMSTLSYKEYDTSKHDLLRHLHDGYFYHNHGDMWSDCARRTIPALMGATKMLMCGEDLGFVPACVPPVMRELGVIGLRIQRMPGPEDPGGKEFGMPSNYSYWSVASPSCHDVTTLRAWYEEDEFRRERFFYQCLQGHGEVPATCTPQVSEAAVKQHLAAPSILCIIPLQDWLALSSTYCTRPAVEETINSPTNKRHYWRWRMQPTIEALLEDKELLVKIQNLNLTSGRATADELRE